MGIESRILQLMEQRQEMVTEGVDVTEIEARIVVEIQNEVRKVDGCAAYDRHLEREIRGYDEEIDRLQHEKAKSVAKQEWFRDLLFGVMKRLNLTTLKGALGSKLSIKQNSAAVEIAQPELVPIEYQKRTIVMSEEEYQGLMYFCELYGAASPLKDVKGPEPMKSEIARALKHGDGVPGCSLVRGERIEIK